MRHWRDFIQDAPACDHGVQIYGDQAELVDSVAAYVGHGLAAGAPAIVVATPEHRNLLAVKLELEGLDVAAVEASRLLTMLDADESLAAFMDGSALSKQRFEALAGEVLDDIEARFPGKT